MKFNQMSQEGKTYQVIRLIKNGGFGQIYEIKEIDKQEYFALKIIETKNR